MPTLCQCPSVLDAEVGVEPTVPASRRAAEPFAFTATTILKHTCWINLLRLGVVTSS